MRQAALASVAVLVLADALHGADRPRIAGASPGAGVGRMDRL